ncbi:hypothetical protein ACFOY8_07585 [Thalassospira xianhensis]|uniref:DUF2125 domain-containing protein n=1 Tax=Thalassospira xianhensis MCCC 1A02616 TaxID=1177929 RepID=A0A367U9E6_9PROT|nr:hypothetical protein [Thalassospira xianhensis]RCK03914.1 hypothetical protein TH5_22820 [Thalassospira xianhensis MCCC 1A02616]
MPARRIVIGIGVSLISLCATSVTAFALETQKAREIMDAILMQNGISATEMSAENSNGAVIFTYDDVRLDLSGYSSARELVLDDVRVTMNDTDIANQVDIGVTLPERGKMLAEATSDQRELTMRKALGSLRWDHVNGVPVNFTGSADFLIGDEPVTRKHWLMNGLVIRWMPEEARISWQAAEWTGPNREKLGSVKSTSFLLYPGENDETHLDYAHDGLWLPSLLQPRTVRIKSSSTDLPWSEARPILQKGFNDMMTGLAPRAARRQIANDLWQKAADNGAPVKIDEIYVEGRGLEALGKGEFIAQKAARYGFSGQLDVDLIGRERLQDLIGTPQSPTLLGALVPFAVDGLAAGEPGKQGTTNYDVELLRDGRIVVNGITVFSGTSGS